MEGVNESGAVRPNIPRTLPTHESARRAAVTGRQLELAGDRRVAPAPALGPHDTQLTKSILARGRSGTLARIGSRDPLVDFTYVDNAALAHLLAADKLAPGAPISGKPFFVSQGEPVPLWTFVDRLLAAGSASAGATHDFASRGI